MDGSSAADVIARARAKAAVERMRATGDWGRWVDAVTLADVRAATEDEAARYNALLVKTLDPMTTMTIDDGRRCLLEQAP